VNLGKGLRGKPRNKWEIEVREDGKLVGGEVWQKRIYNREEWKNFLRTARNRRILQMPMNDSVYLCHVCNGFPKLGNATVRPVMPVHLSVCSSA